ncbi:hypothetical protein EMIT0P44_80108 [Pseudomonas sp. IT-P44]
MERAENHLRQTFLKSHSPSLWSSMALGSNAPTLISVGASDAATRLAREPTHRGVSGTTLSRASRIAASLAPTGYLLISR